MKKLLETISFCLFMACVLACFFMFQGEPDLWDKLHDKAMNAASSLPVKDHQ